MAIFTKSPADVLIEGQKLLATLEKEGITNHTALLSRKDLKKDVDEFMVHLGETIYELTADIRRNVDSPVYHAEEVNSLRRVQTELIGQQDKLLRLVGNQ